ncbi:PBP GOBP domain containing protein [Asbolus verrucosus]|uniref:PBP GOBP domain containing protein n=1 Tax=Asbolus verrucosus TaxID=1661398 RepID=A0A482VGC8_ASBVE|nr:PBP GOBP domain containing protein [Asbolus verrucosus]
MRVLLTVIACFSITVYATKKDRMKIVEECNKVSGVDKEVVKKAMMGIYVEDPLLKKDMLCYFQQLKDKYKGNMNVISQASVKCTVEYDTPEDTAFNLIKCTRDVFVSSET